MRFVDFPPFCTMDTICVTFCLHSAPRIPSENLIYTRGTKFFSFSVDNFQKKGQTILVRVDSLNMYQFLIMSIFPTSF